MREKIIETLEIVFEQKIDENSSIENVTNWDSMRHLVMILSLEEEFDVTIPDDKVGDLISYKIIEEMIGQLTST